MIFAKPTSPMKKTVQRQWKGGSAFGGIISPGCAGSQTRKGPFKARPHFHRRIQPRGTDQFDRHYDCDQHAADQMVKYPNETVKRVVINTASAALTADRPGGLQFFKAAVVGMTLPMPAVCRLWHRVVTIAPGLFDTPTAGLRKGEKALVLMVPFPNGSEDHGIPCWQNTSSKTALNGETIRRSGHSMAAK